MNVLKGTNKMLIFGLAIGLVLFVGCKKKTDSPMTVPSNPNASLIDASNVQVISDTEEKELGDYEINIRTSALKGDFQSLESQLQNCRSNKVTFPDGYWKLRAFYMAFGDYHKIVGDKTYPDLIGQLEQWASKRPDSIGPRLALAEAYHGYAWMARGSGWGGQVTDQGERLMEERMAKGFGRLREAQKLQGTEKDPAFYAITLHSLLGANVDRKVYEGVFEKGVQNAPDYYALYEYKAYYLLPRWYGEAGEWETFAREITKRKDIPGSTEIFARIALYLRDLGFFYDEFSKDDQAWEELKGSFHAVESNHPDSLEIKSILCLMSVKMCDYKEAREQAKMLDGKVDLSVWGSKTNFIGAIDWMQQDDATLENCRLQWKAQTHHSK